MRIPLVGSVGPGDVGRTFAPIDPGITRQVGEAGERLGEATAGLAQLPLQIKQAMDQGALAKAESMREAGFQTFVSSLSDGKNPQNNDPTSFGPRWQEAQKAMESAQMQDPSIQNLSFAARRQLQVEQTKWSTLKAAQINDISTQKALLNARGEVMTGYNADLAANKPDMAIARVENGMKTGIFNPEEGKEMIYKAPITADTYQLQRDVAQDPIAAYQKVTATSSDGSFAFYRHLVGDARSEQILHAYRFAQEKQYYNQNDARSLAADRPDDPDTVPHIQNLMKTGQIPELAGQGIIRGLQTRQKEIAHEQAQAIDRQDKEAADRLWTQIHDDQAAFNADPKAAANSYAARAASILSSTRQKQVYDQIENQRRAGEATLGKQREAEVKPVEDFVYQQMREDREKFGTTLPQTPGTPEVPHWYGNDKAKPPAPLPGGVAALKADVSSPNYIKDEDIEKAYGKGVTREMVLKAEEGTYSDRVTKMRDWFSANPPSGSETSGDYQQRAVQYMQKLNEPYVYGQVAAALKAPIADHTREAKPVDDMDTQARLWAEQNPDDPRAKAIFDRLGQK